MTLRHLVLLVAHDRRAVNILRYLPAKALIEQIVLWRRGQILAASYHMGDAHEMIIDYIGKIISRKTVTLKQHLIIKRIIGNSDVSK